MLFNSNEKVLMGTRENKLQKLQIPQNKILLMTILPHAGPRRAKKLQVYVFKNGAGKVCF